MPPYQPVVSKAQSRKLFSLAGEGRISEDEARGKTREANWKGLPDHVGGPRYRTRKQQRRYDRSGGGR
jgi:hypothetical protein